MVKPSNETMIALMYHGLFESSFDLRSEVEDAFNYTLELDRFDEQMRYLLSVQALLVTISEISTEWRARSGDGRKLRPCVLLTFDDGHISNYTLAYPMLLKYSLRAHFFITSDWLNSPDHLNEKMVRDLYTNGMIIGSHGRTHRYFSDLSDREVSAELRASKERLEAIIEDKITCLSAPGGRVDERVLGLAREQGYSYVFGSCPIINYQRNLTGIIGRYAIRRGISPVDFARIVAGQDLLLERARFEGLGLAKRLFGNKIYETLRGMFLRLPKAF